MAIPKVTIIRVPFGLGAGRPGAEYGPEAILQAGLVERLEQDGIEVVEVSDITPPPVLTAVVDPKARYLPEVMDVCGRLAVRVAQSLADGTFPLILGGDHSIAAGSIAGATRINPKLGVIWFDAHTDLNTVQTSPSGNVHGMSLAASLGWTDWRIEDAAGQYTPVQPSNVVFVGARDLDPGEKDFIRKQGIACFTMHEIDRMGMEAVMLQAIRIASHGTDGVHLSFDIDSVDPREAPGTGTPVRGGVSYREAHLALELLSEAGCVTSADFVEVNPTLDINQQTSTLVMELICSLFGERIL
ncbi:arginase [Paenibacillus guangzhouensis]|uniref:arginase n=1 Tax=Paenibacillus guangzhouensis TaxID=1473112 RepID=UPI001267715D|nr:arginase [Paenibacillus guangzhouensis]